MPLPDSLTTLLILLAAALPLLNAALLAVPRWRETLTRWSPLSAVPAVLVAVAGAPGATVAPFSVISLGLDETGRVFLGFSSVLWLLADWFARGYLPGDRNTTRFYVFFLLSMVGNFALILARDIPTFYSGFALMGFASCGLVVHRGDEEAVRAGRVYLVLAAVGEVLLFSAFGWLAAEAGSVEIAAVVHGEVSMLPMFLLLVGFGIKTGALSLHFWLPLAHPAAPVPASAVLSGVMIKAGLLGWLRFLPLGLVTLPHFGIVFICAGLAAALLATAAAITQRNPKTVLAYSSLSQMGIITVGLGVAFLEPEAWPGLLAAILAYALHHGLAKGSLFLGITPATQAARPREILLARIGLIVPALALAGAPFTSGAMAKLALKAKLDYLPEPWGYLVGFALTLAACGTTLMMARFFFLAWPSRQGGGRGFESGIGLPWMLSVVAVIGGIWWLPGSIEKIGQLTSPKKLWLAFWPVFAGAALAFLCHWLAKCLNLRTPGGIPAGDIVVPIERLFDWLKSRSRRIFRSPGKIRVAEETVPWLADSLRGLEARLRGFSFGAALIVCLILIFLLLQFLGQQG